MLLRDPKLKKERVNYKLIHVIYQFELISSLAWETIQ